MNMSATVAAMSAIPAPPFRLGGHNLGMSSHLDPGPILEFFGKDGVRGETESVEFILQHIDDFADERDRKRLLCGAARHYGFDDPWTLITGRDEVRYDVLDAAGRILLAGVTHDAACSAVGQLEQIPCWAVSVGSVQYVRWRDGRGRAGPLWDWRHEGPLVLLHHSLGVSDLAAVAVRSHVGGCCITLEETLRRLDQFSAADQAALLAALANHFDLGLPPAVRATEQEAAE